MSTFKREDLDKVVEEIEEIEEIDDEEIDDEEIDDEADEAGDEDHRRDADDEAAIEAGRAARLAREAEEEIPRHQAPAPVEDLPMPDMADEDVAFDNDKFRAKMAAWVKIQGRLEARRAMHEEQNATSAQKFRQNLETKVAAFEKTHPDFKKVVRDNKELAKHQLHPDAGALVVRSRHAAELLYRFGKDLPLAIRTSQQHPLQQAITIDRMIREIEATEKTAPKGGGQRPTISRNREEALSGKQSMADMARESRQRKMKGRFYK